VIVDVEVTDVNGDVIVLTSSTVSVVVDVS